jgi:hypothetical protein
MKTDRATVARAVDLLDGRTIKAPACADAMRVQLTDRFTGVTSLNFEVAHVFAVIIGLCAAGSSQAAQAAEPTGTLTLACQGTKTYKEAGAHSQERTEPFSRGIIVNLTDRTVTGLDNGPLLTIDSISETTIRFGSYFFSKDAISTNNGTIDRLTGDMAATSILTHTTGGASKWSYSLKCKPTQRMF